MVVSDNLTDEEIVKMFRETFGTAKSFDTLQKRAKLLTQFYNAMFTIFGDSIYIGTRRVSYKKTDGREAYLYLPKKFYNHPATVIIWPKGRFNFAKDFIFSHLASLSEPVPKEVEDFIAQEQLSEMTAEEPIEPGMDDEYNGYVREGF